MAFMRKDVLKKLLKGLMTNMNIIIIERAVHMQIFFVSSEKRFTLSDI
jgi:hypothetical protein